MYILSVKLEIKFELGISRIIKFDLSLKSHDSVSSDINKMVHEIILY